MGHSHWKNKKPITRYLSEQIGTGASDPATILDLGIGAGDIGKRIKTKIDAATRITGVEVWEKCRGRKWAYYDEVVIQDIRTYVQRESERFDFVLLIDVLEHLDKPEGTKLLDRLKAIARRAAIVSTPITTYPQGSLWGNPYQRHRCVWPHEDLTGQGFRRIFAATIPTYRLRPLVGTLGVYVYEPSQESYSGELNA